MIQLRLATSAPFDGQALLRFLGARAIAGLEEVVGSTYRRSLVLRHGAAIAELKPRTASVRCLLSLDDPRDRAEAVARCRRLLGLDTDPVVVAARLGRDPLLGALVRRRPGLRVPGCTDGFELAVRAILGQQVTLGSARQSGARLVELLGAPLPEPSEGVTHRFPAPEAVVECDASELRLPRTRAEALRSLARLVVAGELELEPEADRAHAGNTLLGITGVGPWTASYVAMRALADPDAFPAGDAGLRRALERLGHDGGSAAAERLAERWRPWRAYAAVHLWASLNDATAESGSKP
jgi:AraC family transcriptional regulator, regulatory protein of adaptative response / DNA-3-methyladenine glycosylase II